MAQITKSLSRVILRPIVERDEFGYYNTIQLDGFNLIPGLAIAVQQDPSFHERSMGAPIEFRLGVITHVLRDADSELVNIVARFIDNEALYGTDEDMPRGRRFGDTFAMTVDYCEKVDLIGVSINTKDKDDTNIGSDYTV